MYNSFLDDKIIINPSPAYCHFYRVSLEIGKINIKIVRRRKMKLSKTTIICGVLSLLLLCAAAVRAISAASCNNKFKNGFYSAASPDRPLTNGYKAAEESPYIQGVPMEEIDFDDIRSRYIHTAAALPLPFYDFSFLYTLTDDITYYTVENGNMKPAFTVPKGTEILWFCGSADYGYGLYSYPTYQKGWRYARPFRTLAELGLENRSAEKMDGNELDNLLNGVLSEQSYYYVRLDDLKKLSGSIFTQEEIRTNYLYDISSEEAARTTLFWWDDEYYRWGVFCSPDLQKNVWDIGNSILLAAAVICAAAAVIAHLRRRKNAKTA